MLRCCRESGVARSRRVIPGAVSATKVTYWSTGPKDAPMTSTGVVYRPEGSPPEGGWPVISYAHGTVGVADQCAPSSSVPLERTATHLGHWLEQGYAVVTTDYVGLGTPGVHPYLDGRSAAHSVVDMVRAARAVDDDLSSAWVAMGQSQGGQATMFTASLPLITRRSWTTAALSPLVSPRTSRIFYRLGGPAFPALPLKGTTVYIANVLDGLRASRPDIDIDSYLTPLGKTILDDVENNMCYTEARTKYGTVTLGQVLTKSLDNPVFMEAARELLTVPTAGIRPPVLHWSGVVGHRCSGTADTEVRG